MHRLALIVSFITLVPALAAGQQFSPTGGKLRVGQKVYVVVDAPCTQQGCGGEFVDGRVAALTPEVIAVESQGRRFELPSPDVRRVETHGDTVLNGLAYGFAFGTGAYFVAFFNDCGTCQNRDYGFLTLASAIYGGSIGAAIGLVSDALTSGRTVIFDRDARASVAPMIRNGGGGVRVSVRF